MLFTGLIHAGIGSNKAYAAIHQFGGMAGRGHTSKYPAPSLFTNG
jgi:phage gpG-like protein